MAYEGLNRSYQNAVAVANVTSDFGLSSDGIMYSAQAVP
jgi:hypothetical protein